MVDREAGGSKEGETGISLARDHAPYRAQHCFVLCLRAPRVANYFLAFVAAAF
jgi:hypothetical protein